MKPHEEEWMPDPLNEDGVISSDGQQAIADIGGATQEERSARRPLVSAAPNMARALLEHGRFAVEPNGDAVVWHTEHCWATNRAICTPDCQRDRAALRKAGVL